jgi:hypothetical protein
LAEAETTSGRSAPAGAATAESSEAEDAFAASAAPPAEIDDEELVVVHVVARREALENKEFERLLISNGISITPASLSGESNVAPQRDRAVSSRVADGPGGAPPAEQAELDVVLVDAPATKITKFLGELNQDYRNYLGVSVDDPPPADKPQALETPPAKKLALDLGKYSRGRVPQQQKEYFARNKSLYYQQAPDAAAFSGGRGGSTEASNEQQESLQLGVNDAKEGRAQRVPVPTTDSRYAAELEKITRELKASAISDPDNLQVLFVLAPSDEPAASPPAENRAE